MHVRSGKTGLGGSPSPELAAVPEHYFLEAKAFAVASLRQNQKPDGEGQGLRLAHSDAVYSQCPMASVEHFEVTRPLSEAYAKQLGPAQSIVSAELPQ